MKTNFKRRIWAAILIPLMLAIAISWLQTGNLITRLVQLSEKAENARTEQLVQSAFTSHGSSLAAFAQDGAFWDEAARNLYYERDLDWYAATYPTYEEEPLPVYDGVAIVNGNNGQVEFTSTENLQQQTDIYELVKSNWAKIVTLLPEGKNDVDSMSALVKTSSGGAFIGVSPIVSPVEELQTKEARPHYLLVLRYIDQPFLQQVSEQYAVKGLTLLPSKLTEHKSVEVSDKLNLFEFSVSWISPKNDLASRWELWQPAFQTLSVTLIAIIGLAIANLRLMLKMQRSEEEAVYAALHDSLTGLGNRFALEKRIEDFKEGIVLFADLDGFKNVNDTFGHKIGDQLLFQVATLISNTNTSSNNCFRLGADEFLVLFLGPNQRQAAEEFASRLIKAIQKPFNIDGNILEIGVSIGISLADKNNCNKETLVRQADEAMYLAKKSGGNSFLVYDEQETSLQNLLAVSEKLQRSAEPVVSRNVRGAAA